MTDVQPTQALVSKVIAAAKESGYVQKDSSHAQGYKYADDEAITTKFRNAMIDQGVLVYPEAMEFRDIQVFPHADGVKAPNVLVSIIGHLAVTDGAASLRVASLGQGIDRGDKAIYKAMTGFKKYGYRHLVMMATGDDPEKSRDDEISTNQAVSRPAEQGRSRNTAPQLATKEQHDELKALRTQFGLSADEMTALRKANTDKAKPSEFTVADFEAMKKAINEAGTIKQATGGEIS